VLVWASGLNRGSCSSMWWAPFMNEIKALVEFVCQVILEPLATGYMLRCGNALGFTAGQEKDVAQRSGGLLLY
jgi:hypothetical protein